MWSDLVDGYLARHRQLRPVANCVGIRPSSGTDTLSDPPRQRILESRREDLKDRRLLGVLVVVVLRYRLRLGRDELVSLARCRARADTDAP
jgi:hypothetical protein